MEFFDLPYCLIQKDFKNAQNDLIRCEERIKNLQRYLGKMMAETAASIGKILNRASHYKNRSNVNIIAKMINTRRYGKGQKKIKENIIKDSKCEHTAQRPDSDHFKKMNLIKKQLHSFYIESRKIDMQDRRIAYGQKNLRKPAYVDIRRIRYMVQFDLTKYNRELRTAVDLQKKLDNLSLKSDERIKVITSKHELVSGMCPLCIEDDDRCVRIKCGHIFHAECLTNLLECMVSEWRRAPTVKCPMCRTTLN